MGIKKLTYSLAFPIKLANENIVLTGITFEKLRLKSTLKNERRDLYGGTLQLGYLHYFKNKKFKILLMAFQRVNADIFYISKKNYQAGGVLLLSYKKRNNFSYKVGLYYNLEFFGNFFMPLVGLDWKISNRLQINGVLPAFLNLEYKINKKLYFGLSYNNFTQSYRINGTNNFICNGDNAWGNIHTKVFINYYLYKQVALFVEGGYTFFRKYEAFNKKNEVLKDNFYSRTENGPLIIVGLAFRIRTDNE